MISWPLLGVEAPQVSLGHRPGAALGHHLVHPGNRRLGQDGERGDHDLELARPHLGLGQEGLVLPGQQHVAEPALGEGDGRAPRAGVEHRHVGEQLAEILHRRRVAAMSRRPGIGRHVVPARAAGGLGIGRDHLHAWPDQVAPVVDVLGIALADQEDDGGRVGRGVLRQAGLPSRRDQPGLLGDGVDVGGDAERHHVGLQPVDHRQRLLARAAVALVDGHVLAGLALPIGGEDGVVGLVELTRRIVADVQQCHLPRRRQGAGRQRKAAEQAAGVEERAAGEIVRHGRPCVAG